MLAHKIIAVILLVTGGAKFFYLFSLEIIGETEPLTGLSTYSVNFTVAMLEVFVVIVLLYGKSVLVKHVIVFILGSIFLAYHAMLSHKGVTGGCGCLGGSEWLVEDLGIIMKTSAVYIWVCGALGIGSILRGCK